MVSNEKAFVFYCRNMLGNNTPTQVFEPLSRLVAVEVQAVPCSGKIDPRYLIKAFEAGAKAVCVITCPLNACKLIEGNLRAAKRVDASKQLMAEAGLNPERLRLFRPNGQRDEMIETVIDEVKDFLSRSIDDEVSTT